MSWVHQLSIVISVVEFSLLNNDFNGKLPVECSICKNVMHRSQSAQHLETHLVPGETKRYQCIYCNESYKHDK